MSEEKGKMPKGCVVGLAIAGGLLVIVIAFFAIVYFYRGDLISKALEGIETQVVEAGPEGYTESDIHQIFELYGMALDSGWVSQEKVLADMALIQQAGEDKVMSAEEASELLQSMREVTDAIDRARIPAATPEEDTAVDTSDDF
ncbi:MAG: hypothetical protein ACE5GA_08095 [Candidatus Zixiibacteriota bacterium]